MTYFKSLFFTFLTIFFVNHVIAGVEIIKPTKLPQIEGELIFAASLAFISSLIFPILRLFSSSSYFKIGLISFIVSFGAYGYASFFPAGIHVTTLGAFFWCGVIVWFASYLTNHLELKHYIHRMELKELREKKKELQSPEE